MLKYTTYYSDDTQTIPGATGTCLAINQCPSTSSINVVQGLFPSPAMSSTLFGARPACHPARRPASPKGPNPVTRYSVIDARLNLGISDLAVSTSSTSQVSTFLFTSHTASHHCPSSSSSSSMTTTGSFPHSLVAADAPLPHIPCHCHCLIYRHIIPILSHSCRYAFHRRLLSRCRCRWLGQLACQFLIVIVSDLFILVSHFDTLNRTLSSISLLIPTPTTSRLMPTLTASLDANTIQAFSASDCHSHFGLKPAASLWASARMFYMTVGTLSSATAIHSNPPDYCLAVVDRRTLGSHRK